MYLPSPTLNPYMIKKTSSYLFNQLLTEHLYLILAPVRGCDWLLAVAEVVWEVVAAEEVQALGF